jgi:hypothetical protein
VVIAAGIDSHESPADIAARTNFDTPAGYNFDPVLDPSDGIYGGAGVTLLDTLTVSNGIGTMDNFSISVGGKTINNNKGAGIYNIDSGLYLRNVRIIDCNSVDGGGMYTTGNSTPVLKTVSFTGNRSFLYEDRAGHGAGMAVGGGKPVLIDCLFRNNASVGGNGAGMYISGGSVFLRGARFELNNTSGSGSFYNTGNAWIFGNSEFKNNTGGGIVNAGTLKLANVTIANNGVGLSNSGTLSGTNLTITNSGPGISNSSKMAITNTTISSSSTAGVNAAGGVTVLANTVLNANSTGLSFALSQSNPDDITEQLKGCILFNVTITGGTTGVSASYSSAYSNNHGAASLLLNNVRISGASGSGLALAHTIGNYNTNPPRDNRGLYVTLNNVTIAGNGAGITTGSTRNIAAANAPDGFDELNLRVRNSIILGNGSSKDTVRSNRFVVGSFGFGSTQVDLSGNSFYLNPDKAPLLAIGDAFRIAKTTTEGSLRTPVYIVTGDTGGQITYDATPVYTQGYPATKTEGFALGDSIVKTAFTKSQFELGVDDIAPDITPGENIWYLDPAHTANVKLHINDVFRMGDGTAATGASFNTIRAITLIPEYFPTDAGYLGKGSWIDGDGIAADYPSAQIGEWVYNELGLGTRWERINDTGTGSLDWNDTGVSITPADKHKVTFTASTIVTETITAGNKHIMTDVTDTLIPGGNIVNLAGHTLWQKTLIGGVDEAVTGSAGLITGVGVPASAVFDATYRLLSAYTGKGADSLYPLTAASLVSQLYGDDPLTLNGWGYKFKGGGTAGQEAAMTDVLDNWLYTWLGGVYEKVTDITSPKSDAEEISLGNDNGGRKGDQRAPVSDGTAQRRINGGDIDIGAYEN